MFGGLSLIFLFVRPPMNARFAMSSASRVVAVEVREEALAADELQRVEGFATG